MENEKGTEIEYTLDEVKELLDGLSLENYFEKFVPLFSKEGQFMEPISSERLKEIGIEDHQRDLVLQGLEVSIFCFP